MKKATVTIRRPDGTVETIDVTAKFGTMSQTLADKINEQTKAAGRGEVIGWSYEAPEYQMTNNDKANREYDKTRAATLKALNA
jgi:hypothetical protein